VLTRRLEGLGRSAGAVGLGCVGMSAEYNTADIDDDRSLAVLARAMELGVTLFDTADAYGPFTNETLLGRGLREPGRDVVVATKVGLVMEPGGPVPLAARRGPAPLAARRGPAPLAARRRADPAHIRASCEASLRRLGREAIDLYYLHRVDPAVPLEVSWGALADLVAAGKARALGLCEVTPSELDRAHAIHPVSAVQSELSLWTRAPLDAVVPWCAAHGAAFVAYAPLGRGYLTGTVLHPAFQPDDIRFANPRFTAGAIERNQALLAVIGRVARRHDATLAQVAIAWTLAQGRHVLAIPGTKRVGYLEENCRAAELELTREDLADLDAMPQATGDRY
jgi:aryl-alcohol dehydrogenase-like predicted oxidoreductase